MLDDVRCAGCRDFRGEREGGDVHGPLPGLGGRLPDGRHAGRRDAQQPGDERGGRKQGEA
ncbi:hypothetical protein GCM10009525_28460 [Streptosporangium amethystogenes subsp. fukuiense]